MILGQAAYLVLLGVLGYAAVAKLRDLAGFAAQVAEYRILPVSASGAAARAVVAAELAAAALLVAPASRPAGAAVAAVLLAVFLAAQCAAWARGLRIGCACFGGSGELETVGPVTIVRTLLLLLLATVAMAAGDAPFQPAQLLVAPLLAAAVGLLSELTRLLALPGPPGAGESR
jgi:hypothetical protein